MEIYRDEATGRRYAVRPDGSSYWLSEEAGPREVLEPFPDPVASSSAGDGVQVRHRERRRGGVLVAVLVGVLAAGGGFVAGRSTAPSAGDGPVAAVQPAAEVEPRAPKVKPDPEVCRSKAAAAMAVALIEDGNLAEQLKVDLAPFILAAAAEAASKP